MLILKYMLKELVKLWIVSKTYPRKNAARAALLVMAPFMFLVGILITPLHLVMCTFSKKYRKDVSDPDFFKPEHEKSQDQIVKIRSVSSFHNTTLHKFSQYQNNTGKGTFSAREPGLCFLKEPSVN